MRVTYDSFFQQPVEGTLPEEVFRDDMELWRHFLKTVGKPGWLEKQREWSQQQADNARNDNLTHEGTVPSLVGTRWLSMLDNSTLVDVDTQTNVLDLEATCAFHFLEMDPADIPHQPGNYLLHLSKIATPPWKQSPITRQLIDLEKKLQNDVQWAFQLRKLQSGDLILWTPQVDLFLEALGLKEQYARLSHSSYRKHWAHAIETVLEVIRRREHFAYACFVADTAFNDIVKVVPSWSQVSLQTRRKIAIHVSRNHNQQLDAVIPGTFHHVVLYQHERVPNSEQFLDDYLTAVHEFIHCILQQYLFPKPKTKLKLRDTPHLLGVIDEGVAIAVEQAVLRLYHLDELPSDSLPGFSQKRVRQTLSVLAQRHSKDLLQLGKIAHYTEGVRYAKRSSTDRKRIADLPKIIDALVKNALQIIGSNDPEDLYTVPVTNDPDSLYQRIIRKTFGVPGKKGVL